MSSLTNFEFLQGILYLKTRKKYPLNRKLYNILFEIDTRHRNKLSVDELEILDSVINIPILILEVKPTLTEEEQGSLDVWNDIENWKGLCLETQEDIVKHIFNEVIIQRFEEKQNEEHERVMMGFEDYSVKTVQELDREIEDHENFMMGFEDHPAKTVEELDREKREFFKLMYQSILSNLNFFIQNFINFNSQDNVVLNEFEEKELEYIKNNILVNLIKIHFNVFDFLNRFELSKFFLFHKMILFCNKIVSYEEEIIVVGKTPIGKIEMINHKKKINQECLKQVMRNFRKFISNGTLEVQGHDGSSCF